MPTQHLNDPVYADFESNKEGELFMLSIRHEGQTTTYLLDERLAPLADSPLAEDFNLVCRSAPESIALLESICARNAAPLAAYSEAEKKILQERGVDLPYLNVARLAKKWVNRRYRSEFEQLETYKPASGNRQIRSATWSLMAFAKWLDLGLPPQYGRGKTTSRIKSVMDGFTARGPDYSNLTRVQKTKARQLLLHNVFDVEGLQKLFRTIGEDDPELVSRFADQ